MLATLTALWKLATSRLGMYGLLAALVVGAGWWGYHHIVETAKAEQRVADQKLIDAADARTKAARDTLASYKASYQHWLDASASAQKLFNVEQAALVSSLREQLAAANTRAGTVRTITKEVIRYVSPTADAACVVPNGFVWLFNGSIETGAAATAQDGLPGSTGGNADASSGIALSAVGRAVAFNHGEAVQRGLLIHRWQEWYASTRASFTKAQQAEADSIPREP